MESKNWQVGAGAPAITGARVPQSHARTGPPPRQADPAPAIPPLVVWLAQHNPGFIQSIETLRAPFNTYHGMAIRLREPLSHQEVWDKCIDESGMERV